MVHAVHSNLVNSLFTNKTMSLPQTKDPKIKALKKALKRNRRTDARECRGGWEGTYPGACTRGAAGAPKKKTVSGSSPKKQPNSKNILADAYEKRNMRKLSALGVEVYSNQRSAMNSLDRHKKGKVIVMGKPGEWLVMSPRLHSRAFKGYEVM